MEIDIARLLQHFRTAPHSRDTALTSLIGEKCTELFQKDYNVVEVNNSTGHLCFTYPEKIIIIESLRSSPSRKVNDAKKLKEIFEVANTSRVRNRFPVPVILYNNKNICRSSTISQKIECISKAPQSLHQRQTRGSSNNNEEESVFSMNYQRGNDIQLIKELKILNICDLMVEDKKKKYLLNVASSEKVDSLHRYNSFFIASLPYPGCEFFKVYKDNKYNGEKLYFPWDESHCKLQFYGEALDRIELYSNSFRLHDYKNWDLCQLTQNYFKVLLYLLEEENEEGEEEGMLVHCISGWDRTPMFISLLRMSLWADGVIHQSLSAAELLFLTIAYDWFLFQHDLPDRTLKGEDIFYFCFDILCKLQSDDFSISSARSLYQTNVKKYKHRKKKEDPKPIITSHLTNNVVQIFSDYCDASSPSRSPSMIVPIPNSNPISIHINQSSSLSDNEKSSLDENQFSYGSWEPIYMEECAKVIIHQGSRISIPDSLDDYSSSPPSHNPPPKSINAHDYDDDQLMFFDFEEAGSPKKVSVVNNNNQRQSRSARISLLRELFLKAYRKYLS